jgi:hypothetical protein
MPSARTMSEGSLAFSWTNNDPYLRGSILAYPFEWLEASYQYVDINNALYSNVPEFSGGQTYKDKSFDIKIKILSEENFFADVALGARDLAGTGVFGSEFLVATKAFGNLDISLGLGWGNLSADKLSNPLAKISDRFLSRGDIGGNSMGGEFNLDSFFSGPASIFGGIEYRIPNLHGARLKLEYDATDYRLEGFPFGKDSFKFAFEDVKQSSNPFNIGIVYPISNLLHLKLSYVKGNTLSFGFSLQASLAGKSPLVPKQDSLRDVDNYEIVKRVTSKSEDLFYKASLRYLNERDIYISSVNIEEDNIHIAYAQSKFTSFIRASGRAFTLLDQISPEEIKTFTLTNLNAGQGMHKVSIDRDTFAKNKASNHYMLTARKLKIEPTQFEKDQFEYNPKVIYPVTFWNLSPSIRSQIGGPDGFYFGDARLSLNAETLFRKNLSLRTNLSYGFFDTFDELKLKSDSLLPRVRTEINEYLKGGSREIIISSMQLNYFDEISNNLYYKISAGIMEPMFGAIGGELMYRPFFSNYAIGAELWRARKRDYNQLFDFKEYETTTGHLNFYYKHPRSQVLFHIKGGRFLAEDSGLAFDFSRRFKSGLRIGAFFSRTDISKAEFGEGSFDKGFYFFLPVEVFFGKYSKQTTGFGLRPITRDGGASLIHSFHLYGITEQAQFHSLSRDYDDLYE